MRQLSIMWIQQKLRSFLREQQNNSSLTEQEKGLMLEIADKVWRRIVRARGFAFFTEEVLGFNNAGHQNEWCNVLGNKKRYRRIVDAAPRNHSKSTEFSVNYPLWEIADDPNVRILLVSGVDSQSQSFLREIKGRIERDQSYVDFAGQLKPQTPEKWTDKEIILKRTRTDIKDPTISTSSVEGTILAKRADIIICDDLLNFENTRTPEQRQKIKDWFNLVLLPVLEPKTGRLIVVGTIWQVGDLMEDLLKDPTFDFRKRYQAIIKEPEHSSQQEKLWQEWCNLYVEDREDNRERAEVFRNEHRAEMDADIQVLWPERFSYDELYMLRYSDPYAFARAYMNDPASRPSQLIKREWIEAALKKGANLKLQDAPFVDYTELTTEGVDLAISQETASDDTAKVTLDKLKYDWNGLKAGSFVLRQIKRGKMTGGETKTMITTDFYAIRPHGIRVESVAYQEYLVRELNDNGIPVRGHRTGSEKWDSSVGVNTIGTLLEHGLLAIPSDSRDARTKDLIGKLVAEMLAFPEGHTGDSLMALWFSYLEMVEIMGTGYLMPKAGIELMDVQNLPAPENTPERKAQEREADLKIIDATDVQRARALYWKEEERKLMSGSARAAFRRRG